MLVLPKFHVGMYVCNKNDRYNIALHKTFLHASNDATFSMYRTTFHGSRKYIITTMFK